jgi:hypothetical protein
MPEGHITKGAVNKSLDKSSSSDTECTLPNLTVDEVSPSSLISVIQGYARQILLEGGVDFDKIESGDIRLPTIVYMTYWHHRLHATPHEQETVFKDFVQYLGDAVPDAPNVINNLLSSQELRVGSAEYVNKLMVPSRTVDLVITKQGAYEEIPSEDRDILCVGRTYYPFGSSLPGGFIRDTDIDNVLGVSAPTFAALRVAGEKVLGLTPNNAHYLREFDDKGKEHFTVRKLGEESPAVKIYVDEGSGYHFRENIQSVFRPSDSRHLVDTVGFKCELVGEPKDSVFAWLKKGQIMSSESPSGGLAFNHHREIIAHIGSRTSLEKERELKEHNFIRSVIEDPLGKDAEFQERFNRNNRSPYTSFPELLPAIENILELLYSDDINEMCEKIPTLTGVRDLATMSLRHCTLKNKTFCPYLPTILAIHEAIKFFDIIEREKVNFYDSAPKDRIIEHNPKNTPHAYYHNYRYAYRMNETHSRIPDQIILLTFEALDAEDLLRVRGSRNRLVGLSKSFLYVDEFFQSGFEFLIHDYNHSYRMIMEDEAYMKKHDLSPDEYYAKSIEFSNAYLDQLKIRESDSEEQREMKKLKKIILFEVCHEDARPFLPDVLCQYIQQVEGQSVPFEGPHIDPETNYFDILETRDTGIATLSYVRNKLQNGFYDQVDSEVCDIVDPKYRTSEWIAKAAYEMLAELQATPSKEAQIDPSGRVSLNWLLLRTVSVGPDNVHESKIVDPILTQLEGEARFLNEKRYQL